MINSPENPPSNESVDEIEKQFKIDKKVEAIKKQSPEINPDVVEEQAKKEVDNFVEVWGAVNKLGGEWYSIEGESKEKMAEWKNQVVEILNAMDDKNFHEKTNIYLDKIPQNIERESKEFGGSFDDEAKTLLAISLWLQREQGGKWAGNRKILWRIMSKDSTKLSSILDKNGAPACVDTSFLIKALAEEFDIKGEVKKVPMSKSKLIPEKMSHFYFQSETGKIVDYWWARSSKRGENTGGLKLTQEAYEKTLGEKNGSSICGY